MYPPSLPLSASRPAYARRRAELLVFPGNKSCVVETVLEKKGMRRGKGWTYTRTFRAPATVGPFPPTPSPFDLSYCSFLLALRGAGAGTACQPDSIWRGRFEDDEKGFYAVYRSVFDRIEELEKQDYFGSE